MSEPISKSVVKRLRAQSLAPSFRSVYERWLQAGQTRRKNPWRPETVKSYKSQIETNILPIIGEMPIDTVGNKALNSVSEKLHEKGLAASTIERNINTIKDIREFLVNEDGEPIYPVKWNSDVIDAPTVDKTAQKHPIASAQTVTQALRCAAAIDRRTPALFALLAATGMRVQEALAVRIGPGTGKGTRWIYEDSKIIVEDQRYDSGEFGPTKTPAGVREIDLPTGLNEFMKNLLTIGHGHDYNLAFPEAEATYRRRLINCGVLGGFHALRRYRTTHIRMQDVPESLVKFWTGHADPTVTGRYTQVGSEIAARKVYANKVGLGFEL